MLDHLQRKRRWSWLKVVGARINYWQWLTLETGPVSFCLFLFIPFITIICVSRWYFRWWYSWWLVNDDRLWSIKQKTRKTSNETKAKEISRQNSISRFKWFLLNQNKFEKYLFILNLIWPYYMARLNSEDFSKFFPCWDILFLTYSYESTHREVQKNAEIFSIILEYSWFFRLFRGFSYKTFLSSELQSRVYHHKIPRKILHRTVIVRSRGLTGEK